MANFIFRGPQIISIQSYSGKFSACGAIYFIYEIYRCKTFLASMLSQDFDQGGALGRAKRGRLTFRLHPPIGKTGYGPALDLSS